MMYAKRMVNESSYGRVKGLDMADAGPIGRPRGAHLVGSVPLANSEAVFRELSARLPGRLRRVPDGEIGIRTNWIQSQFPLLLDVYASVADPA